LAAPLLQLYLLCLPVPFLAFQTFDGIGTLLFIFSAFTFFPTLSENQPPPWLFNHFLQRSTLSSPSDCCPSSSREPHSRYKGNPRSPDDGVANALICFDASRFNNVLESLYRLPSFEFSSTDASLRRPTFFMRKRLSSPNLTCLLPRPSSRTYRRCYSLPRVFLGGGRAAPPFPHLKCLHLTESLRRKGPARLLSEGICSDTSSFTQKREFCSFPC